MQKRLNVLSLFDGISCGQYVIRVLLKELSKKYRITYYASEVDPIAIGCTQHNWPETIQLGDVRNIIKTGYEIPEIDLLIGGSPCQGVSLAGLKKQLKDPRSRLFFEFVRIMRTLRKRNRKLKFMLENVVMTQESQNIFSKFMECEPLKINSELFSVQARPRLYWTNISQNSLPEVPCNKMLIDILEQPYYVGDRSRKTLTRKGFMETTRTANIFGKAWTLQAANNTLIIPTSPIKVRNATAIEHERVAGLSDNYTQVCGSYTKRVHAIGNGWECNTIAFLLYNYFKQ